MRELGLRKVKYHYHELDLEPIKPESSVILYYVILYYIILLEYIT